MSEFTFTARIKQSAFALGAIDSGKLPLQNQIKADAFLALIDGEVTREEVAKLIDAAYEEGFKSRNNRKEAMTNNLRQEIAQVRKLYDYRDFIAKADINALRNKCYVTFNDDGTFTVTPKKEAPRPISSIRDSAIAAKDRKANNDKADEQTAKANSAPNGADIAPHSLTVDTPENKSAPQSALGGKRKDNSPDIHGEAMAHIDALATYLRSTKTALRPDEVNAALAKLAAQLLEQARAETPAKRKAA